MLLFRTAFLRFYLMARTFLDLLISPAVCSVMSNCRKAYSSAHVRSGIENGGDIAQATQARTLARQRRLLLKRNVVGKLFWPESGRRVGDPSRSLHGSGSFSTAPPIVKRLMV